MKEKTNASFGSLRFIYKRNKPFIISWAIILTCILIFFQFIIPQYKALLSVKQAIKDESSKLDTLKKNLNMLVNTNENSLNSQLGVLNQALPVEKDFDGILSSIYYASQKTDVSLGTFSLKIGELSNVLSGDKFPTISLSLPINGGGIAVGRFVEIISNTFPLSEVSLVKIGDKTSNVNLSFYYKPLDSKGTIEASINPISQKGLSLIDKLESFENVSLSNPL